jgi:hypothetical protein
MDTEIFLGIDHAAMFNGPRSVYVLAARAGRVAFGSLASSKRTRRGRKAHETVILLAASRFDSGDTVLLRRLRPKDEIYR